MPVRVRTSNRLRIRVLMKRRFLPLIKVSLSVCVSGCRASVYSDWEQDSADAWKMPENTAESPPSVALYAERNFSLIVTSNNRTNYLRNSYPDFLCYQI